MKSEITKTSERRRITLRPARTRPARFGRRRSRTRRAEEVAGEPQHLVAPAARLDDALDRVVVEHRTDAVAAAREQAGERRDELGEHQLLRALGRAERHRRRAVEQQPRGELAVGEVLPHVRRGGARGDVPVDVAHVVAGLVLAQVGEVDPRRRRTASGSRPAAGRRAGGSPASRAAAGALRR